MSTPLRSATTSPGRSRRTTDAAVERLDGIGDILAELKVSALQTPEETMRALWTLDTASKCVRAIMAEFRTEPATEQMIRKSEDLINLIELARDQVIGIDRGGL